MKKSLNAEAHAPDDGLTWTHDIEGALSEAAVAKAIGRYWEPTVNNFYGDDGCGYQVRCTRYRDGHLLVRDKDKSAAIFILVVGSKGMYEIIGWIQGSEAKQEKYQKSPLSERGYAKGGLKSFWIPQLDLHPMEDLPH